MHPTSDGFIHQSRQDDGFIKYEAFVECVCFNLQLAALKRRLNEDEVNLLQLAAELTGDNGIIRTINQATAGSNAPV